MKEQNDDLVVKQIIKEMNVILADGFILYTKLRNYHWNVTGPYFYALHATFEQLYDEMALDVDAVAERIRTLGFKAPATLKEYLKLTSLKEDEGNYPHFTEMVNNIADDYESLSVKLNATAKKFQDELNDEVSAGMFYGLVEKYQKHIWMLKAVLEK
ncbi:DNA starvation/stationary phase protection protein [bacterium]|nr:DNA starvation/stationary phase protection protein [bacterium]